MTDQKKLTPQEVKNERQNAQMSLQTMANTWTADKLWTYTEVEHAQGSGTTNLYPTNTGVVGHGSKVKEGMVWQWGEREAYYGVSTQTLLGEMSCWDDISPQRKKDELKPLDACHEG